jgi:hypothetical protein
LIPSGQIRRSFVANEVRGSLKPAQQITGGVIMKATTDAQLLSLLCGAPGNCAAGGYYITSGGQFQAFVLNQVGGRWGPAEVVPGTAALNVYGVAELTSVSCPSAGNCGAGGF